MRAESRGSVIGGRWSARPERSRRVVGGGGGRYRGWHALCGLLFGIFLLLAGTAHGQLATGGTVTNYWESGKYYTAHIFTNTVGTADLTFGGAGEVQYLVVAGGGGGGGGFQGGGGGAGGVRFGTTNVTATTYKITVGDGGAGAGISSHATNGFPSSITNATFAITTTGGGRGASEHRDPPGNATPNTGGSGGGGQRAYPGTNNVGGLELGNWGGNGATPDTAPWPCGGGGGARTAGAVGTGTGGAGGSGTNLTFSGTSVEYAKGGTGGYRPNPGTNIGANAAANTGNGGNGGGGYDPNTYPNATGVGGKGGSGIVIVRYAAKAVNVTAPTNIASFPHYASITVTAQVVNASGTPTVQFFTNNAPAGAGSGGPTVFTLPLGQMPVGTHSIYATMTDDDGTYTSPTNSFTVNALSVTLNNPEGNSYTTADDLPGTATVANASGSCTVTFYTNGVSAGSGSGGPPVYGRNLGKFPEGELKVYAVANDVGGATATSGTNTLQIGAPTLRITMQWPSGQQFTHDVSVTTTALVEFAQGSSTTVTFYATNTAAGVGSVTSGIDQGGGLYAGNLGYLGATAAGSWQIYAKVVDGAPNTATSGTNTITAYSQPTVGLTAPTEGQGFDIGGAITATASPGGGNGSYTVYFYTNSSLSGTFSVANPSGDNTPPTYSAVLNSAVAGTNYVYATVTDGNGKTASSPTTNKYAITTPPTEIFVAPAGTASHSSPYKTWATAATNIATAIAYATANPAYVRYVTVSNGQYDITDQLNVTATNLTIRSFGGGVTGGLANASNTVVRQTTADRRVIALSGNTNTIDGIKITGGNVTTVGSAPYYDYGAGILLHGTNNLVMNSIIAGNSSTRGAEGVGVKVWENSSATLTNCEISGNSGRKGVAVGGSLTATYILTSCPILNNSARSSDGGNYEGGVAYLSGGGSLRNCLIASNSMVITHSGESPANIDCNGLVYMSGPMMENCTVVSNVVTPKGVGIGSAVYITGSNTRITNSIVYFNSASSNIWCVSASGSPVGYSCTTNPVFSTSDGNISADPKFKDFAARDYRLQAKSPCIDTGSNQTWMVGATDLAGTARLVFGGKAGSKAAPIVDMGAYEAPEAPPSGTVILVW